jgi:hypothetical protein
MRLAIQALERYAPSYPLLKNYGSAGLGSMRGFEQSSLMQFQIGAVF